MTYIEQETIWNDLQRPEKTYNEEETTWKQLQRARNNLKQPTTSKTQTTTIRTYLQQAKKARKDQQQTDYEIFLQYGTIGSLL